MTRRAKVLALLLFYAVMVAVVQAGWTETLFPILTGLAASLAWVFVVRYGFWSPWQRSVVGRSLMYVWIALAAVLTLVFFSYGLGAYPGRDYVRALFYSSLIPAFASFVLVLVQQQTKRGQGDAPPTVDTDL